MEPLSYDQLRSLATDHAYRVVSSMDVESLISYAMQQIENSYFQDVNADQQALMNDIFEAEDQDSDSVFEFLVGCGIDEDVAEKMIGDYFDSPFN